MAQGFWDKVQLYGKLTNASKEALHAITRERIIYKNEFFVPEGGYPKTIAFVLKGLFSQYYISPEGEVVIKKFFPEHSFMASLSALITRSPSVFSIKALETSAIVEYSFSGFKELSRQYPDIASVYISYLEQHWIVEKEPLEISYRHDNATIRYLNFLKAYPGIEPRIKQHEVAAYLGITPTQLSRIRTEISGT